MIWPQMPCSRINSQHPKISCFRSRQCCQHGSGQNMRNTRVPHRRSHRSRCIKQGLPSFHMDSLNFQMSSEDRNLSEMKRGKEKVVYFDVLWYKKQRHVRCVHTRAIYPYADVDNSLPQGDSPPRKTGDHCFVREMKRKTKKREKRGGKERKREIKREDNRGRERRRERDGGREGGACGKKTEKDRLKSFKLFFPLNNPSFVQI